MFQDLDALVIQQEVAVQNIEQQGEQVEENVGRANVELDGAIVSASAARRKKFICLGIISKFSQLRKQQIISSHATVLIIIIVVVVVVVVVLVLRK